MKEPAIRRTGGNGRRSSCVACNGMLYISGITTVDIEADTVGQTQDILGQIDRLLTHNGTHRRNVLNATIYLRSIEEYGLFNSVWDEWVDDGYEPTRSVIEARMSLKEYRVKIALVAAIPH